MKKNYSAERVGSSPSLRNPLPRVKGVIMQNFEKWLPNETSKAFRIQLKKYYELKYPDYMEEDLERMVDAIFDFIDYIHLERNNNEKK